MPPAALAMISGRRAARSFVTARYSSPRMSAAGSTSTVRTAWPRMSMPRIACAAARASAAERQSFTPPALPRPPVSTCAFTTTGGPSRAAACAASAAVVATCPRATGMPWRSKHSFAWNS